MELLWLAIVFYSIGLAAVLYLRPAVMFNENGTWKEFGYQRDSRHTIFPVWLFIITWAIISYVLSMVVGSYMNASVFSSVATAATVTSEAHSYATKMFDERESEGESDEEVVEMPEPPKRSSSPKSKDKPRPGYYVLEPGDQTKGLRKYVYYGPSPPTD
jgi:hypothetical protein